MILFLFFFNLLNKLVSNLNLSCSNTDSQFVDYAHTYSNMANTGTTIRIFL